MYICRYLVGDSTPLKNISPLERLFPIYGTTNPTKTNKINTDPENNQFLVEAIDYYYTCTSVCVDTYIIYHISYIYIHIMLCNYTYVHACMCVCIYIYI